MVPLILLVLACALFWRSLLHADRADHEFSLRDAAFLDSDARACRCSLAATVLFVAGIVVGIAESC